MALSCALIIASVLACGGDDEAIASDDYECCRGEKYYSCWDQQTANWCDTSVLVPSGCDREPAKDYICE